MGEIEEFQMRFVKYNQIMAANTIINLQGIQPIISDSHKRRIFIGELCVYRVVLISTFINVCLGLTAALIMINGIVFSHSSEAKEIVSNLAKFSSQIPSRHQRNFSGESNDFRNFESKSGKKSQYVINQTNFFQNLKDIIIQMKNVIDNYDVMKEKLEALYPGAKHCEQNKCETFPGLPEHRLMKDFKCKKFVKQKDLKKSALKLILEFHNDVQIYIERFEELIISEKLPNFKKQDKTNGSRLKLLIKLQTDMKMLIVEIETVIKDKRLNLSRQPIKLAPSIPNSQTDLMIDEWRIIQQSKKFLEGWRRNFNKKFKCWKKIKANWSLHSLRRRYRTLKKHFVLENFD